MSTADGARRPGAGREGPRTARPTSRPGQVDRIPDGLLAPDRPTNDWAITYRRYGLTAESAAGSGRRDLAATSEMVHASLAVAATWRAIASVTGLPWWVLAAVETAAQAFEAQASEWEITGNASPSDSGRSW
jgi:hypothetical protein